MALEELKVGVCAAGEDLRGWLRILHQEGVPHQVTSEPAWPLTLFGETLPGWFESYVAGGGTAVVSGAPEAPGILPPCTTALIHRFETPGTGTSCYAPGIARLFRGQGYGKCRLHEDRKVLGGNMPDLFPAVLVQPLGKGRIILTGIQLTRLLVAGGDCLRRFSPYSEVSERVAGVDKADVADTLLWMLASGFRLAGIPYVRPVRYPDGAPSVFIFRVDVDGAFGDNTRRLAEVAARHSVRGSFFFNASRCRQDPGDIEVAVWGGGHEIGQHGYTHDVFEDMQANLDNLIKGAGWVEEALNVRPRSFVAPRGLWNDALDHALARAGYTYSSDFALDFDSLPFRTPAGTLQIPVHPYSPERAFVYAQDHGLEPPTSDAISNHYMSVLRRQVRCGRPVHLYGHPERLGALAEEVLPPLFDLAQKYGLPNKTLGEFCEWWEKRERADMALEFDAASGELQVLFKDSDQMPVEVLDVERDCAVRVGKQTFRIPAGSKSTVLRAG